MVRLVSDALPVVASVTRMVRCPRFQPMPEMPMALLPLPAAQPEQLVPWPLMSAMAPPADSQRAAVTL